MSLFGNLISSSLFARILNVGNIVQQVLDFDEQGNPLDSEGNIIDRNSLELAERNHYIFYTIDLEFNEQDKVYLTTASYNFTNDNITYISGGGLKNVGLISPLTIDNRNTYPIALDDPDQLYSRRLAQNATNVRIVARLWVRDLRTNELDSIIYFDGLSIEASTVKNEQGITTNINFSTPLDELGKSREKTTSPTGDPNDNGYDFVDKNEATVKWGRG